MSERSASVSVSAGARVCVQESMESHCRRKNRLYLCVSVAGLSDVGAVFALPRTLHRNRKTIEYCTVTKYVIIHLDDMYFDIRCRHQWH